MATDPSGNTNACTQLVIVRLTPGSIQASLLADNAITLSFDAIGNIACRIEASTNLVNWETLTNHLNPAGLVQFQDSRATNFPQRFYRAVWVP